MIYRYTIYALLRLLYRKTQHNYFRSRLNYFLTSQKIRKALKTFPSADCIIFLTYSFSARKFTDKKVVLFSDWSYLYLIKNLLKREPYWFEKWTLKKEKENIDTADIVLGLFPKSDEFNGQNYRNKNHFYLGNVINSDYPLDKKSLVEHKVKSNKIVFIGTRKYLTGAMELINAFKELTGKQELHAELHFIGLRETDSNMRVPGIFYHGYLDKGIREQKELYYQLVSEAKVIVNTNANWGAFSAITEAMYYYTPVITTAYPEFTETYGTVPEFGFYVKEQSVEDLKNKLLLFFNQPEPKQIQMMNSAHEKVKDFTWSAYTEKVLNLIA